VIDIMPDFITAQDNETGATQSIQVVQIWIDPRYSDAHREPALRRWMVRRAEEGKAAIVRFNSKEAIVIFAPPFDAGGEWHEMGSGMEKTHTFAEIVQALGGEAKMIITH
jgi:hypothetical protein